MNHDAAEQYLGYRIPNLLYGTEGYLTEELDTGEQKWVPKSIFEKGVSLFETAEDKIVSTNTDLDKILQFLALYSKEGPHFSMVKRNQLFRCRKHLQSLVEGLKKLLTME